jgi:hypothetical protein
MSDHPAEVVAERFDGVDPPAILSKPFSLSEALEAVEGLLAARVRRPAGAPGERHAGVGGLSFPAPR